MSAGRRGEPANNYWGDMRGFGFAIHDNLEQRIKLTVDGRQTFLDMTGVLSDDQLRNNLLLYFRFSRNPVPVLILMYDVTSRDDFEFISRVYRTVLTPELDHGISPAVMSVPVGPTNVMSRSVRGAGENSKRSLRELGVTLRKRKDKSPSGGASTSRVAMSTGFPGLPLELQLALLRACLTSPMPITDHKLHRHGVDLNVLQVCRLLHDEGTKIFWNENTFATSCQIYLIADLTWVTPKEQPVVTTAEGRSLAENFGCKVFESSSRVHDDVEPILTELVRENRARNKFHSACSPSSRQRFADVENTERRNHSGLRIPKRLVSPLARCWRERGIWRKWYAARYEWASKRGQNTLDSRHISAQK
ncbi:hypothetical protein FQN54_007314 [Arachnomyces sp. PD_36]|nr:hypothetical protein FQN54_007314 [Arachnomyces sp. PD_36]